MNKSPLQQLVPMIGMAIGVALGIMISLVIQDRSILDRILGREGDPDDENSGDRT